MLYYGNTSVNNLINIGDGNMKKFFKGLTLALALSMTLILSGCDTSASVANRNLTQAADSFELERKIIFWDSRQGLVLLSIEGKCSMVVKTTKLVVTCKTASNEFKLHTLGRSENVTFFSEQLDSVPVNVYNYRVIFRPETIIPDLDIQTSYTDVPVSH